MDYAERAAMEEEKVVRSLSNIQKSASQKGLHSLDLSSSLGADDRDLLDMSSSRRSLPDLFEMGEECCTNESPVAYGHVPLPIPIPSPSRRPDTISAGSSLVESMNEFSLSDVPPVPLAPAQVKEQLFADIPVHSLPAEDFKRVIITGGGQNLVVDEDTADACRLLSRACALRKVYMGVGPARPVEGAIAGSAGTTLPTDDTSLENFDPTPSENAMIDSKKHAVVNGVDFRRRPEPVYDPFSTDLAQDTDHSYQAVDGVYYAHLPEEGAIAKDDARLLPSLYQFYVDLREIMTIVSHGPVKSLAYQRLQLLEARFGLHILLNGDKETAAQKCVPHRDFYNVRKCDTHVHHSAAMNQKHLLRFIKHKLKHSPNEIVTIRDGKKLTLSEVFKSLHLTAYDLSIDTLDMHANNTFHRFDRFNLKYNPAGESRLREIFLKTDNLIEGRYLAEVTREMMSDLTDAKYTLVEWRLSIYGRRKEEWAKLASWFHRHHLAHKNVRWVIQIPRLYHVYKQAGDVSCFQDMMDLIFAPLFEVSVRPSSNPVLHAFLKTVVAFDSVDDESKVDHVNLHPERYLPTPTEWDLMDNPPYTYWTYYLWANMTALNRLRASKGLNTFEFRPHCGEAGSPQHLAACFLVADQINHGIMLRKTPALQYLYYMEQIGIAMSPLSNNRLFLDYSKNPFPRYHAIGMNVSLSTDDPLMLHYTKDPLVEEYSVAAQVWKMSSTDQCEIARNSVLQSGFEARFKRHFLGDSFDQPWAEGNDIRQTNVPNIRLRYRQETLFSEHSFVHSGGVEAQPGT